MYRFGKSSPYKDMILLMRKMGLLYPHSYKDGIYIVYLSVLEYHIM